MASSIPSEPLFSAVGRFFRELESSEYRVQACWFRVIAGNKHEQITLDDGKKVNSKLDSLARLFNRPVDTTNDLLRAAGLIEVKRGGRGGVGTVTLSPIKDNWETLQSQFDLNPDIVPTTANHLKYVGDRVHVVRIGSYEEGESFTAKEQAVWSAEDVE